MLLFRNHGRIKIWSKPNIGRVEVLPDGKDRDVILL